MEKSEQEIFQERKEKAIKFLKEKKDGGVYLILAFIVLVSFYIRTSNVSKLKDITTKTWTLGPDLDPFLFLRWAKDIVAQGSLPVWDYMRYVPLGYNTAGEMKLLSYMIAWFYHFLSFFSNEVTVTYAAIIFPAVMFALTGVAFFLFARKIFYKEDKKIANIIALIATAFFVLIPSLLPRTIAGIPEKESAAFFFMFMAFYLFLEAFTSKNFKKGILLGISAGLMTGLMALIWGGFIFIFFAISPTVLLSFIIGKIDLKKYLIYASWIITSLALMIPFSTRYTFSALVKSTSTGLGIGILGLVGIGLIIMKLKQLEKLKEKTKLPNEIFALIISFVIVAFVATIILGPSFFMKEVTGIKNALIQPMTTRFGLTVAENKQPYFINDWKNSFGPIFMNIPLYFWLFFSGSVLLFYNLVKKLKFKERWILTFSYLVFLTCLIFSRYDSNSILNGISGISLLIYFGGWLFFIGCFSYVYYLLYKKKEIRILKEFEFSYLLYFLILTLGIIGARAGIRLIMVLGAISPVAVAFLIVKTSQKWYKEKDETMKFFMSIITFVILISSLFTLWTYYENDKMQATNFAPGTYQWQWQKAMGWVRENTDEDAVFAHWWDYGYWLQSIGERATILDGGNAIVYWNHLMGRHVLTGTDERKALEFLYSHNGTHLLIDSTEIGKYTAYSSIGADESYDRFSWITTFFMNDAQTQETNDSTIYVYTGGTVIDEDIIWNQNGKDVLLPKKSAGIGAIILKLNQEGEILQPEAVFVYNNQQYRIPLRYVYYNDKEYDFNSGLESGIFLFPKLNTLPNGKQEINEIGALFYMSQRTVHSQMARLYLYNEKSNYFKLVHSENSLIVESMKNQGINITDFIYYQGFHGPIKIWEVSYPKGIKINPDYLERNYPNKELQLAKSGEYN
ncbi:MAG: STT3 domain-containing protein [Nanoarchaeota archaeon]